MKSMEFSGHSVDEAIFVGLTEMGVTIDEVEIETIQSETKGLFGIGAKMAVVRLTEREVPLVMEMEQVYRKETESASRRDAQPRRDSRPPRGDRKTVTTAVTTAAKADFRRDKGIALRGPCPLPFVEEHYDYSEELAKKPPCAVFLGELQQNECSRAGSGGGNGKRPSPCINAETMGLLIGRRGETLDAMSIWFRWLPTKTVRTMGICAYSRYEGYAPAGKRSSSALRARTLFTSVRRTPVFDGPMNPYERRILHSALQGSRE
jgi:spoIIIJ-associated protein